MATPSPSTGIWSCDHRKLAQLSAAELLTVDDVIGVQLVQQGDPPGSAFMARRGLNTQADVERLRERVVAALAELDRRIAAGTT